jgi:TPP-dependent indolepyruvate ferredoxin oxidoreductase alpha subunit
VLTTKLEEKPWQAIPRLAVPAIPNGLPPSYQDAVRPYLPLFDVFKKIEADFVCGDAGVSTLSALPPYDIVHAALYMGGSIPTAIGAYLAGKTRAWSFIGDFSFIAAGHYGLVEAVMRKIPLKVLIFTNGRAQTTGGQPLDLTLLARVIKGYEPNLTLIDDPTDAAAVEKVLRVANESTELAIIAANFTEQ